MKFTPLELAGAYLIELEPRTDDRGYFARQWCAEEFSSRALCATIAQINTGFSPLAGTLRGLHFQRGADREVKVVRCSRGAVFDVIVDLRPDSPSFGKHYATDLSAESGRAVYAPEGFAHGYQTLRPDSEVQYLTSKAFSASSATGVRFDDPQFAISWPIAVSRISKQDREWPDFDGSAR